MPDIAASRWTFEAIGTTWHIDLPEVSSEQRESIVERVTTRIEEFDKIYSRFREDSLVTQMAQRAGTYELPEDSQALFELYEYLYGITGGKFTPLIGQVLSDAGYDADYSLVSKELTRPAVLDDVLEFRFPSLTMKQPALLDFGAAGKGYLVDLVAEILNEENLSFYVIDASGDIKVKTSSDVEIKGKGIRVGLEHPDDPTQVIGVATISHGSICGSATNRRAWRDFHHIIDPDLLVSPRHIKAVWVTADTALLADALTTCLFFMEPHKLREFISNTYAFEYLVVYADLSHEKSSDFPAELFLETSAV